MIARSATSHTSVLPRKKPSPTVRSLLGELCHNYENTHQALEELMLAKQFFRTLPKDSEVQENLQQATQKLERAAQTAFWHAIETLHRGGIKFKREHATESLKVAFESIGLLAYIGEEEIAQDFLRSAAAQERYQHTQNRTRCCILHSALKFIVQEENSPTYHRLRELKNEVANRR